MESLSSGSFKSGQADVLARAYDEALQELSGDFDIDQQARMKLAMMLLTMGRKRIELGGTLAGDEDVKNLAALARERLLLLRAG